MIQGAPVSPGIILWTSCHVSSWTFEEIRALLVIWLSSIGSRSNRLVVERINIALGCEPYLKIDAVSIHNFLTNVITDRLLFPANRLDYTYDRSVAFYGPLLLALN